MLREFIAIVNDASGSGSRVFQEWTANPKKFSLNKLPEVGDLLLGLTETERAKFVPLLEYFTRMSFFYLFTRLEEGEAGYSFNLTMKNESGQSCSLVDELVDREIRHAIR